MFPVKKEAVGNSGKKETAGTRGSLCEKEALGNFLENRGSGSKGFPVKKRLWEIPKKKRL